MRSKKILILGTGNAQVDFIQFCKGKNYFVHACSYKNEGRGIQEADMFSLIDIKNVDAIKKYVEENGIDMVYSTGSDIAMPSVTRVSSELALPTFITCDTATVCNNKNLFRKSVSHLNTYSIIYKECENYSDLLSWELFPAIVKPNDSQGQRGITKVARKEDLFNAYNVAIENSRTGKVIIEEFVEGNEISINLYVYNGLIKLMFLTERISFKEFPGGVIKKHLYPVSYNINYDSLRDMSEKLIKTLNIENGPAYFQVIINKSGLPKIIEVAPRLDGCHLWRLINVITGINLFDIILKHLSNKKLDDNVFDINKDSINKNAELYFFTSPPNTPFSKKNYNYINNNALYTEWYYREGEIIRQINNYAEKTGYQIVINE